jgi:hypothetical protein
MGWEQRRKKRCLYHTRRIPGGFVRDYLGSGPIAVLTGKAAELAQMRRRAFVEARALEHQRYGAIERQLVELAEWAVCLAGIVPLLPQVTWHSGARRDLDVKGERNNQAIDALGIADLRKIAAAASAGDHEALARLRRLLDTHGAVWRAVADFEGRIEEALIDQAAGGEQLLAESLRHKIAEMKVDLAGAAACDPLDKLLIDQIVANWLHLQIAEIALATAHSASSSERWRRTLNSANRMQLEAIRQLADLRRERQVPTL